MIVSRIFCLILLGLASIYQSAFAASPYYPTEEELSNSDIEIIASEQKVVYEYRVAGRLMAIKVVPKLGPPYYMVPADGSAHFEGLDHAQALYPKWVLFEW